MPKTQSGSKAYKRIAAEETKKHAGEIYYRGLAQMHEGNIQIWTEKWELSHVEWCTQCKAFIVNFKADDGSLRCCNAYRDEDNVLLRTPEQLRSWLSDISSSTHVIKFTPVSDVEDAEELQPMMLDPDDSWMMVSTWPSAVGLDGVIGAVKHALLEMHDSVIERINRIIDMWDITRVTVMDMGPKGQSQFLRTWEEIVEGVDYDDEEDEDD